MGDVKYATVSVPFNEEFYEEMLIQYFTENLGYEYLYGPDVERTSDLYQDAFLPRVIKKSLCRINPDLPPVAIDEAIAHHDKIETFLQQEVNDPAPIEKTLEQLSAITHIDIPNEESFQAGAGAAKKYLMPSEAADLYKAEIEKPPADYTEE